MLEPDFANRTLYHADSLLTNGASFQHLLGWQDGAKWNQRS